MLAASAGLISVLNSAEQNGLRVRLQMTLPGGVYPDLSLTIESLSIEASITTDMPDGTRLEAGYPAMQATFTLSGFVDQRDETKTAAWLFGFYNTASPLYRKTSLGAVVTIDVGAPPLGTATVEYARKFTGTVDSLTIDADAGTVEFTCIDNRNKLRSVPALPAIVTAPPYNAGLTSEFVVDALLRAASQTKVSSWPARRTGCVLAAGMRSSVWPELGTLTSYSPLVATSSVFVPGVFGTAYQESPNSLSLVYVTAAPITTSMFMEFWITGASSQGLQVALYQHQAGGFYVSIEVFSNKINVNIVNGPLSTPLPTYTWTVAVGTGPQYIGAQFSLAPYNSTAYSGTLYCGAASQAWTANTSAYGGPFNTYYDTVLISGRMNDPTGGATVEAFQMTSEGVGAVPNNAFVPTAILDPSLNSLQVVPSIDAGTDPWQVIQQVADAELAVAGFDESGIFHFYNRKSIRARPVVRTITSTVDLKSLSMTSDASAYANHVTVPYTSWSYSARGLVFTNTAIWSVAANSSQTFPVSIDGTVGNFDTVASSLPNGHVVTDGSSWYRASTTAAGIAEHPGPLYVQIAASSQGPIVTITNYSNKRAYFVSPANYTDTSFIQAGQPAFWIGGITATAGDEVTVDYQYPDVANGGAASSPRGDVAVALASDPWIQDRTTATTLALDLLIDLYLPRPDFGSLDIVPDWRLQLLDRVLVQDLAGSGVNEYATIWGWTLTFDAQTWDMTVDARTVTSPGQWILGVAGRSELGVTTYI